jgi:chromosome segregation ATPase
MHPYLLTHTKTHTQANGSALQITNHALSREIEALHARMRAAESAWIAANSARENSSIECNALREQVAAHKSKQVSLRRQLDSALEECETLRLETAQLRETTDAEVAALKGTLDGVVNERNALRAEVSRHSDTIEALGAQLDDARVDMRGQRDLIETLRGDHAEMQSVLRERERDLGALYVCMYVCMYVGE